MLKVEALTYLVKNRPLVRDVTFSIRPGELLAIAGANGAGKSTLLDLVNGVKVPASGTITLHGKQLAEYKPEELAMLRATLTQQNAVNMAFTVAEIVGMGRYPHHGRPTGANNDAAITESMQICGIETLADRSFLTLSGGEQQRVHLARVLAQLWDQPQALLVLDEPTGGLDLQYQQQTLAIARALTKRGFMVIAVLHELNLAAQYADRIMLMKNGRRWKDGSPMQVLTPTDIYVVFAVQTQVYTHPQTLTPLIIPAVVGLDATTFNSCLPTNVI